MNLLANILKFGFILCLPVIVKFWAFANYYADYLMTNIFEKDPSSEVYDFIIVGAGSSGSVLANRLSKNNKILLLEAGGDPLHWNSIPGLALEMLNKPEVDWMHKIVQQKNACLGLNNNTMFWPRGKSLGGSSNLNYMIYLRSHPKDYDHWAKLSQDPSWKYENLVQYFKKHLIYNGSFKQNEKEYKTGSFGRGYLHVESMKYSPLYQYFIDAGKEFGFEEMDLNLPYKSGFGPIEFTQKNGQRWSTYPAFLKPKLHRRNLKISKFSQAYKIKLDKNYRAEGVWFIKNGIKKFARASREIILSAGSIDTPKLLMLSGIGPKKHLESIRIKSKLDLPVGKNLQDHIFIIFKNFLIDKPLSFIPERDFLNLSIFSEYLFEGQGPLTSPNALQGQAFISTENKPLRPNIQMLLTGAGLFEMYAEMFSRGFNAKFEDIQKFIKPHIGNDSFLLSPILLRPRARGEITLKDNNPQSPPIIDPRYLTHPKDVEALIKACKFVVKLVEESVSFQKLNARLIPGPYPGCESMKVRSDAYWECYIRHMTLTLFHPVGTARMGQPTDPRSVVDSKMRVLGARGLRVIDASIMPKITSGNTNAPCIMIGEKGADEIRGYWQTQNEICDKMYHISVFVKSKIPKCFYLNNKLF